MKRTTVWAVATIVASVAMTALPLRTARADEGGSATSRADGARIKVGRSGRVYVWQPGGC